MGFLLRQVFLPVVFLCAALAGCNHLFYQPTRIKYVNPDKIIPPPDEQVYFHSDNQSQRLVGWYFQSPQVSKGTLVVFHGNAQNVSSHFLGIHWILQQGYDYFIFDYPGYGGSTGHPNPENTVQAGLHALNHALRIKREGPLFVLGQSLGGVIALRSVAEWPKRRQVCSLFIESSFLSYQDVAQATMASSWITWPLSPLSYLLISDKFSPEPVISQIEGIPLVVIHRRVDPLVPFPLGQQIYDKAPSPKELWALSGHGHIDAFTGAGKKKNRRRFLQALRSSPCPRPINPD